MDLLLSPGLILVPLVFASVLLLVNRENAGLLKILTLLSSLVSLCLVLAGLAGFNPDSGAVQFVWTASWLPQLNLPVVFGWDGLSAQLLLLTSVLSLVVFLGVTGVQNFPSKGMLIHLLLLQSFLYGVFLAKDLISFYIFWEATLIPMYFIIGLWGGEERVKANLTFFIFTMVGSLLLLVSVLFLGTAAAAYTSSGTIRFISEFSLLTVFLKNQQIPGWVFFFVVAAFGIKAALFPLHAWLPKTYTQAPWAGLILLSGVMAKMGTYGMLLFGFSFMPSAMKEYALLLSVLAVTGILYAAWIAYTRKGLKEIVAFSSMSHMGFILLGIFAGTVQSVQGSAIQMLNHGISTGAVFLLISALDRRNPAFDSLSGLSNQTPVLATAFMIAMLSSIGLPGLNGFIGEFTILLGSFSSPLIPVWITGLAAIGVILAAAYMLKPYKTVFFGDSGQTTLSDLNFTEILAFLILLVMIIWVGVAPAGIMNLSLATVHSLLQ
ncbi:MAG: NADH-quinone oxidoreductase subunit M [Bacteroidetes bacterium]|nr:NADH-quinone oxidoreductase subunit M [Bacteroidota bacterium]